MKIILKLVLRVVWILTSLLLAFDVVYMTFRLWGLLAAIIAIPLLPFAAIVVTVVHLWHHAWSGPIEIVILVFVTATIRVIEAGIPWRKSP